MPVLVIVVAFGLMIFIHELGHFVAAKSFGVLVHEFSMGMGPKLFSFKKGETQYSLRLFPIGGYVKLEGEVEANDENDPRSFINLSPIKRIIILFAGALMNLILGFVIFAVINMNSGIITSVIQDVPAEYKEQNSIFMPGDEILKLNNTRVHTFEDVSLFMSRYDDEELSVKIKRNEKIQNFENVKLFKTNDGYKLGVSFAYEDASLIQSTEYALYNTVYTAKAVYFALGDLISGKAPMSSLSGPVEIVAVVDRETKDLPRNEYTFLWILSLVAMITVNLGIFNLLPFPALDGGSIIIALFELFTRKKVKSEVVGYITTIGFVLLMLLAIYVTADDIYSLVKQAG